MTVFLLPVLHFQTIIWMIADKLSHRTENWTKVKAVDFWESQGSFRQRLWGYLTTAHPQFFEQTHFIYVWIVTNSTCIPKNQFVVPVVWSKEHSKGQVSLGPNRICLGWKCFNDFDSAEHSSRQSLDLSWTLSKIFPEQQTTLRTIIHSQTYCIKHTLPWVYTGSRAQQPI